MKNGINNLLKIVCLFCLGLMLVACKDDTMHISKNQTTEESLDRSVSTAILLNQEWRYLSGEARGEGHIILGFDEENDETRIYALTTYGEYGFQDGNFVKISGSGVIPAVIILSQNDQGALLSRIEWPEDGTNYSESIKNLFPSEYEDRVLTVREEDRQELKAQERAYAEAYLKKIKREATIGEYADFKHTLLTDVGVSVEVSNKLLESKYSMYPLWIGNQERIEDNIRFVYEKKYDENEKEIILTKYNYETSEIVQQIIIDSISGIEK